MANFNKVILMGNLTRDPELRTTQGGTQVTKFGLAVNRKFKDQETTCFADCTAFGKQAELIAQYLKKGSPLFVEGRLQFSQWEDSEGNRKSKLEIVVEQFQFMGERQAAASGDPASQTGQGFGGEEGFGAPADVEIPF
jgi:single-strand DNA-binding protein